MARIDGHGISLDLPGGFEGEIFGRPLGSGATVHPGAVAMQALTASGGVGPTSPPVVHVATFPLPPERGDYGNGAVDHMGTEDVFVALLEHDRASASSALFSAEGFPRLTSADFETGTLHRSFPHHSGCQRFFHVGDRAFCLYVVLGSHRFRGSLVRRVNQVIERITLAG